MLENGACTTNDFIESPDAYPSCTAESVHVPRPDPAVFINSPLLVTPGDIYQYNIRSLNTSRMCAEDTYIIHQLPDVDGDGTTEITLQNVIVGNGEQVYYHQDGTTTAPAFDINNPTSNGWSSSLAAAQDV